ncbi:RHS repeat-associated core domain-containing protein [Iodobacter arcticus]|uniref:RHS repeat-associated core domain-containing protein n=1 Tax=Iodobacter arcticus TaxID=590593 RepID=A0ABW2R2I3_9NEIS
MTSAAQSQSMPVAVVTGNPKTAAQVLAQTNKSFDEWLLSISDGHLSVEKLKTVGSAVPIVGNLISVGDVVVDLMQMSDKQSKSQEVDVFDWLFLGVDLVGVVPGAGNLAKIGVRPALKLCASSLRRVGGDWLKVELSGALVGQLATMLPASYRDTPQEWVNYVDSNIQSTLQKCGTQGGTIIADLAQLLISLGSGNFSGFVQKHIPVTPITHYHLDKTNDQGFWATVGGHLDDLNKSAKGVRREAAAGMTVAAAGAIDLALKDSSAAKIMLRIGKAMAAWGAQLTEMLLKMYSSHLKPILKKLLAGFIKHLPKKLSAVSSKVVNKVKKGTPQQHKEVTSKYKAAQKPGPACSCATSPNSIGFALGEESLQHTDFSLPGVLPIVWTRQYRSNFEGNDLRGELGARWTTPYTSRFDIEAAELKYHDATGRTLTYPLLPVGESIKDVLEGFTLSRLSETLLSVAYGHELVQLYEQQGKSFRLALIKDRAGNSIAMNFRDTRMVQLISSAGAVVDLEHDTLGRITTIKLQDPQQARILAQYQYSPQSSDAGDLIAARDENEQRWQYQYQNHLLTRYTDRTGRGITLEWDGQHADAKAIREYADDGSMDIRLAWDKNIDLTYVTDALGQTTEYYFDEKGYNYRIVYPDHNEEWFNFDAKKQLISHIFPDGSTETFEYDDEGNMLLHERQDGSEVRFSYDQQQNPIEILDPTGEKWLRAYNAKNQLIEETDPLGHKTQYAYNEQGLPVSITDAKGGKKQIKYRPDGLLQSYSDCSGKTSQWQYDARGRLIVTQDAAGNASQYQYGSDGQLAKIINPDGTQNLLQYDAEGRLLSHADALQRKTQFQYDRVGRVSSRLDAAGQTLSYQYDKLGRLTQLSNENKEHYRFSYDLASRLQEETDFGNRRTRYQYEASSGRLLQIEEAGKITTLAYDNAGRLSERSSGLSRERFKYDALGRIYAAKNQYSECHFGFDAVGNLIKERHEYKLFGQQQQYNWQHEYDELGNRIASIRPDGQRTDWLIYGSGHVHGMLWNKQEIASFERDDLHRETQRTLGNQLTAQNHFDKMGRITQQTLSGKTSSNRSYQYDPVGQLLGIQDSRSGQISYQYDPVGRLIAANSRLGHETFAFDPASNLVGANQQTATNSLAVPAVLGNLLKQYAGSHYKYDARSNLIEKQQGEQITKFTWDGFNRLSKISSQTGETKYFYDVFGRRIGKENALGKTEFIWDGDVIALEKTAEQTRHYLFEPNSFVPLAQIVSANDSEQEHTAYYHVDHLGTPQTLSDENGEITWSAEYKAWGEAQVVISEAAKTAGINNPLRFQGQYFDEESGLHYNRYRYYDPEIGRFISSDPIGLMGGFNTHAYAPNPVYWVDPFGLAKSKNPNGYKTHDADAHGNLSPACNRASGHSNTRDDGFIQSHHPVQDEWAKQNKIPGYSSTDAPAVLLPSSSGAEHAKISAAQRTYRRQLDNQPGGRWGSTTLKDEFNFGYKSMIDAGVSPSVARKATKKSYKYFNCLGAI